MKKLIGLLVIAAIIVGGIIYGESNHINSKNPQATSNSKTISTTNKRSLQEFSDNEILNVANGSSNYNFSTVLNRETSGNIIKAELRSSKNNNVYTGIFDVVNNKLVLDGSIKLINNEVVESKNKKGTVDGNLQKQNINTVSSNNNKDGSNIKSRNFIGATIENTKVHGNTNKSINSGKEAMNLAVQYYSKIHNNINKENLQSSVLANQTIGAQNGYLVQIYNSDGSKDITNSVYLISKNGVIYNGNTDPLQKLN